MPEVTENEMVVVSGELVVDPKWAEDAAGLVAKYVITSRGKPGCLNIDLISEMGDPTRILIYEKWADSPSQKEHSGSIEFKELAETLAPLLADKPVFRLWEPISAHDMI